MTELSLGERIALSAAINAARQSVAEQVTDAFFVRHPDWVTRYGDRGRRLGIEDAVYHQSYLASAIESGSVEPLKAYAHWTTGMLRARNIAPHFVAENLRQIGEALRQVLSAQQAALVDEYVAAAASACEQEPDTEVAAGVPTEALAQARDLYLQAAIKGERRAAAGVALQALKQTADVVDLYVDLFQSSQYEVGRLWETNRITVAEEHMATAITQYVMAQVYQEVEPVAPTAGRMLVTGIDGELHQIGPNMVADVFELRGWDVRFLGTNMPHAGILQAIEEHRPDVVGISATMLFSLPKVIRLVGDIRERFALSPPRIIVGGRAFLATPALCQELGTNEPVTDLRGALRLM
ncbi:MAG: cobalamin-dependent protein [Acidobacteriota bacterium]